MAHNWEEKCVIIALGWLSAIVSYITMIPFIPESMIPFMVGFMLWFFVGLPIIMMVAQKLGY